MSILTFSPGVTPANKAHIRRLLEYESQISLGKKQDYFCECFQDKVNKAKAGYNDATQTNTMRISNLLTSTLGGKPTFGNSGSPAILTYLGGIEGQSGGIPRPPRNKF